MAAITWSQVVAFAPELSSVAVEAQTDILAHVNTALSVALFGGESSPRLMLARIYMAAHFASGLSAAGGGGAQGAIRADEVDGIRTEYFEAGNTGGSSSFKSSDYGQKYLDIIGALGALFVTC